MKQFGVIGSPIEHSLSPDLHSEIYKQINFKASYEKFNVNPSDLENFFLCNKLDGYNVTTPHKIPIITYLKKLDKTAKKILAVNCVSDGIGYNTDWIGFNNAVSINNISLKGKSCLILGAGGVAYSIAYALIMSQVKSISVLNRNNSNKNKLLIWINDFFYNPQDNKPEIIINCTPLGMWPNIESLPTKYEVNQNHIVIDTIYNPIKTNWIRHCEEKGAKTIGGLDMLITQAIASVNIWLKTDVTNKINLKKIKNILKEKLC